MANGLRIESDGDTHQLLEDTADGDWTTPSATLIVDESPSYEDMECLMRQLGG